ncbi:hypothetical protein KJ365_09115 [Glaciecola sp. XM2]|jgi:hypothetical protein|uniref:hypothetical protein n=1 Tax=Glaciecola sp. XM2 TaxID=1914931 RepID=UPI001BDDFC02|nr:hypothetical protein [Glaciecola sp. XM2]MBT1451037.1 hypothetical protein [Glaciecola sp. XM2]
MKPESKTLSLKVRILIGILSIPSVLLAAFLINAGINGDWDSVGAFEVIYAAVGFFAAYIALTGKRFF